MERKIEPVEPVRKTRAVRAVRPIKLHHRPRYRSKLKAKLVQKNLAVKNSEPECETEIINHAHHTPEGVGEHIDFKA